MLKKFLVFLSILTYTLWGRAEVNIDSLQSIIISTSSKNVDKFNAHIELAKFYYTPEGQEKCFQNLNAAADYSRGMDNPKYGAQVHYMLGTLHYATGNGVAAVDNFNRASKYSYTLSKDTVLIIENIKGII